MRILFRLELVAGAVSALLLTAQVPAEQKPVQPQQATAKMTCRGRALDTAGKPIAGASVFLVSTNQVDKPLGDRITDAEGRYEFRDVEIPIPPRRAGAAEDYSAATFQVFGKASGRGLAWRGMKWLYIGRDYFGSDGELLPRNLEDGFPAGKDIELDLKFPAAYGISGRFLDEAGKPVAGVKVRLGHCDYLNTAGKESQVNFREFWALHQAADLMPDAVIAKSDAEGRFQIPAAPPDAICWLLIEHDAFADLSLYTATTANPPLQHDQKHPVQKLPLEVSLRAARSIPIAVVWADTGKPAAGVQIRGFEMRASGSYSSGKADEAGNVVLKLPAGTYKLQGDPPKGSNYVRTTVELVVVEAGEQAKTFAINRGAVIVFKATDAETGAPIEGVSFWYEPEDQKGSHYGVQPTPSFITNPKTNAKGELRIITQPGTRKYGVGFNSLPAGYQPNVPIDSRPGRELVLTAGEERVVEFLLRKMGKP